MRYSELPDGRVAVVAVIGGGASGTLVTAYLLRAAAAARIPLRIALVDRHGRHGLGQAYATAHPAHLLNSPADRMSAVVRDPGHLARWAAANGISHDGFLTRAAFGRYLREVLADAERTAGPTATVTRITSDVVGLTCNGLHRPLRLRLAADDRIDADAAVLATGNRPPAPPCPVPASHRYICDPWLPGALDGVGDGSPVVVIGSGLTMLDVAISLTGTHPETVVHAVSRHALFPREHRCPPGRALPPPALQPGDLSPVDLPGLIRRVRVAAAESPDGWQAAAGWLINATGPAADVTATTDPLLRGLLDGGPARPDSLRLGIEADARGALLNVSGTPSDNIFTLGPPLRGQLYETTAIPEIRDQAAALAGRLLAACHARAVPTAVLGLPGMAGSAA